MSEEDKKVTSNLKEGGDKTLKTNEKKELSAETLLHQKKAAQEKQKIAEEKTADLEIELAELKRETGTVVPSSPVEQAENNVIKDKIDSIEFTLKHKDLSSEAIQAAINVAKMNKITNEEALKDPMVVAFIEKMTEEEKNKNAIPTGNRSVLATDEEKEKDKTDLDTARRTGKPEDWAKVIDKRINQTG